MAGDGGRYRITGLVPGTYTVQANEAGDTRAEGTVAVGPGEVATLDLVLA